MTVRGVEIGSNAMGITALKILKAASAGSPVAFEQVDLRVESSP